MQRNNNSRSIGEPLWCFCPTSTCSTPGMVSSSAMTSVFPPEAGLATTFSHALLAVMPVVLESVSVSPRNTRAEWTLTGSSVLPGCWMYHSYEKS